MAMLRFAMSATAFAVAHAHNDGSAEASCTDGDRCVGDGNALLQVARSSCAMDGQDPRYHHNWHCCTNYPPLHQVLHKWYGQNCTYRCKTCSTDGEDVDRYCGGCGGCHTGGHAQVPCCPGYFENIEDGKHICRPYDALHGEASAVRLQSLGVAADTSCAEADEDPHNGQCCFHSSEPLYKLIGQWSSDDSCSYQCKQCSQAGEDTFRFCGSHCAPCERGGEEYAPCCPGLEEVHEGSKFICRSSGGAAACNAHPQCAGLKGDCCPTSSGQVLGCCR